MTVEELARVCRSLESQAETLNPRAQSPTSLSLDFVLFRYMSCTDPAPALSVDQSHERSRNQHRRGQVILVGTGTCDASGVEVLSNVTAVAGS